MLVKIGHLGGLLFPKGVFVFVNDLFRGERKEVKLSVEVKENCRDDAVREDDFILQENEEGGLFFIGEGKIFFY